MELRLQDKVVIVTGGSKGIGEAITRLLAEEGAVPVVVTRSRDSAARLLEELHQAGRRGHFIEADLGAAETSRRVIEETIARTGKIDAIVNNAGRNDGAGLQQGSPAAFRRSLEINLVHYYDLVHYALPHLIESRGSIVNVSSKVALTGQGGTSGYAASKGAQLALTREWAAELLPFGIRVNAILPAEVMTPLYRAWLENT